MIDYKTFAFDNATNTVEMMCDRTDHTEWHLAYWIHPYMRQSFYVVDPIAFYDRRNIQSWKIARDFFAGIEPRPIILDYCTEVWPEDIGPMFFDFTHVQEFLPDAIVIQGDHRYYGQPNRIWYQHIWQYQTSAVGTFDYKVGLAAAARYDRTYKISCLNRRPMNHKAWWLTEFVKKDWINSQNIFTFLERDPYSDRPVHDNEYYLEYLSPSRQEVFRSYISKLPLQFGLYRGQNDLTNSHAAFTDTYLNIVTESEIASVWFSEKVMKPLSTGQMFVVAAGAGSVECLRDFGFDMFDDIIDHNRYDKILNWDQRLTAVSDLVSDIMNLDWKNIYKQTTDRRIKNIERFWSKEFHQYVCRDLGKLSNI
jgi:hypothetical protein